MAAETNDLVVGINSITQNTIYGLPMSRMLLFTADSTPTIQQSNDIAFGNNVALTLTSGQAEVGGAFIRCTSGNITVCLKRNS